MPNQLKPSVCVDAVFEGLPLVDAVGHVKACGIDAFEFWGWWDKDLDQIVAARDQHEMQIAACCTKFISLVDPVTRDSYLAGLAESIEAAKKLGSEGIRPDWMIANNVLAHVPDFHGTGPWPGGRGLARGYHRYPQPRHHQHLN